MIAEKIKVNNIVETINITLNQIADFLNISLVTLQSCILIAILYGIIYISFRAIKRFAPKYRTTFELWVSISAPTLMLIMLHFLQYNESIKIKILSLFFIFYQTLFAKTLLDKIMKISQGIIMYCILSAALYFTNHKQDRYNEQQLLNIGEIIDENTVKPCEESSIINIKKIVIGKNGIGFNVMNADQKCINQHYALHLPSNDHSLNDNIFIKNSKNSSTIQIKSTLKTQEELPIILSLQLFDQRDIETYNNFELNSKSSILMPQNILCLLNDKVSAIPYLRYKNNLKSRENNPSANMKWIGFKINCISYYILGDIEAVYHDENNRLQIYLKPAEDITFKIITTPSMLTVESEYNIPHGNKLLVNGIFSYLYRPLFLFLESVSQHIHPLIAFIIIIMIYILIFLCMYTPLRKRILRAFNYDGLFEKKLEDIIHRFQFMIYSGTLNQKFYSYFIFFILFVFKFAMIVNIPRYCVLSGIFYNIKFLWINNLGADYATTIGDILNISPILYSNFFFVDIIIKILNYVLNIDMILLIIITIIVIISANRDKSNISFSVVPILMLIFAFYLIACMNRFPLTAALFPLFMMCVGLFDNYINKIFNF